jgi:hypothetical protein
MTNYNVKSRENHWVKKKDPFSLLHDITHLKDVSASYERKIKNTTWLKDLMKISLFFIVFGLTCPGLEPTMYHSRGKHANHYTTDEV